MPVTITDLINALPVVFVIAWACILLLVELFLPDNRKNLIPWLTAIGLAAALGLAFRQIGMSDEAFQGMLAIDGFSVYLTIFVLVSGLFSIALSYRYMQDRKLARGEFYIMMLFSTAGMMLLAMAADLIVVFLSIELLSIPLYIMAAFNQDNEASKEAGMKYFLLGAFAGGFMLYGIALVYGATGVTDLHNIVKAANGGVAESTFFLVGAALILIGLGFKIAAVPFHMWTPDVYEGAPSPATAFMAVGAKAGGFAALIRVFVVAFPALGDDLAPVLWALAALTLIIGNIVAIAQKNIKRLLAYSSISHAGFILMAFVPYGNDAVYADTVAAALFYLLAFALTSFGAWGVVMTLEKANGKGLELDDYAGLGKKYPALALAMLVFMLSFTGIPPTLGFAGKFYLFRAVMAGGYVSLAVVGVLTSLVSAYYYLRLVIIMYMKTGNPTAKADPLTNLVTAVAAVGTVVLFFFSTSLVNWASDAVLRLF